jgi:signal transduction histidine kinase
VEGKRLDSAASSQEGGRVTRPASSLVLRYGIAVGSVALALGVNLSLSHLEQTPSVVFLVAVLVSSWYAGLEGGLTATVLSTLALDYFFIPNLYSLDFGAATWVWLATYVGAALLINWHHEVQRRLIAALRLQDRKRSELMVVLAHELRNFLSPVSLTLAVLKSRGTGDAAIEQACATAERQVRNMSLLINDLLDAARLAQGKFRLSLEPVDLRVVVAQAVAAARPQIESRGHRLETSLLEGPLPLEGDPARLEQVFLNLLTNAAKYTGPGGQIWLTVEGRDRQWVVRVRDNGKGLAPEILPHLFDLFVQAEAGSQGGLGIGLSLVKGLVEMHGGSVAAFSAGLGKGSEFVVTLPKVVPVSAGEGHARSLDASSHGDSPWRVDLS